MRFVYFFNFLIFFLGDYDNRDTEDLDYALDVMLNQNNRIDTDETPLATPGPQLEQPDQDDFGFDHLTDTPQKLKDASYEIEINGHLNASMHGASPPPKMPKGKYKYQTFGACIAYMEKAL